ncbi:LptF/LptG family permease [Sphingomicrobium astaxanthinifaciens]|uniref:LptF/LptG family permease n=1 Tax=Sphingomicrobium astaxanthinifaciens TaxID=1227949 RepID=UPI001FCB8688|nr:LptF/LptG family permease [Sphingomicrobium astaxanthinifaciens]MCJ7420811.1 LptF/LptG family permease [Sphingomicrobium astaxanthinifaciens]
MALIDRYLARAIFIPLLGTLLLAAMLLVLDKMLRLFDFVVSAGGPVSVVWQMLANMLPEYFALGIPIGLLLGILLAFRGLALSSELDALRGIGVSYGRMLRVPYFYAIALLLLNLFIVSYVEPYARYNYEGLRFDLRSGTLGASIKVAEFNRLGDDLTLRIDKSEEEGSDLSGIFVALKSDEMDIAATAARGEFLATDDPDTIIFRLRDGRLIQDEASFATPRTLAFDSYDLPIRLPEVGAFRSRGLDEIRELYLPELAQLAYFTAGADPEQQLAARANLHFRLVEVIMMLMLPLLAIALAVPPKRSSSSLGIFVAIVMVVTYHKINQYAQGAGAQGRLNPELALYVPFVVFVVLIGWMYHVIAHRPGGQPIGALEAAFAKVAKGVKKLLPNPRARALARRQAARDAREAAAS